MSIEIKHTPWDGTEEVSESAFRTRMNDEGLSPIMVWGNASGDRYNVHKHDYHKVIYCIEGSIWFTLPDQGDLTIELEEGDRLDLPSGVRHGAIAGIDGVTCIEGHRTT